MVYVILPVFNEENSIEKLIISFYEDVVLDSNVNLKLIVVNDGSTDGTGEIITRIKEKLHDGFEITVINHSMNRGLAEALKTGFTYCIKHQEKTSLKDIVISMDADNTHPPALVVRMIRLIREGADVVIGSRYKGDSRVIGLSFPRRFVSWCGSWFLRILFPIKGVKDFTCGFRAYRMDVLRKASLKYGDTFITEKGFACNVDILLKLRTMDFVFLETPLILRYDRKEDASKMNVIRTSLETLSLAFRRRLGRS